MLVLMVFSYLVPKETYKVYIQFFISIFIIVLLLKPIMEFFTYESASQFYNTFEFFRQQMENLEPKVMEGEDLFEHFFSE